VVVFLLINILQEQILKQIKILDLLHNHQKIYELFMVEILKLKHLKNNLMSKPVDKILKRRKLEQCLIYDKDHKILLIEK
jgi:hypothetical protein